MKHLIALADSTDRVAWLEARKPLITASQVSALAGSNPYTKYIDVWNEKHDPNWQEDRSWQLDARAAFGREREPHIIEWASKEPAIGGKLTANTTLYAHPDRPLDACTPDAYRTSRRGGAERLIVVDAKTTETDWIAKGVPQYIIDQMLWEWYVTGCDEIYLAVERTKWTKGNPEVIDHYLIPVPLDAAAQVRLDFLLERVAEFRRQVEEDIAPESDIDLRDAFDADPDDAVLFARTDAVLDEIDAIEARIADDVKRLAELKAEAKAAATEFYGRRVHLIGTRRIAKLVRYWKATTDYSGFDQRAIAAATTWELADRLVIDPNPEYQPEASDG